MTFVDIHAIQTLPYSNINRDDLGSPKTVVYGGKERTRVSSQSWKRAVRHEVEVRLGDKAVRTRRIISEIAKRLRERGWDADLADAGARQVVLSVGKKSGIKLEKEKDGEAPATSVLFYLPVPAIDELAAIADEHRDAVAKEAAKKTPKGILPADRITEVLKSRNVSVNLFGRMLAELPSTEVDGAVQFAHAFTVHGTTVEVDFFTAVDDIPKENDHGSGHMNAGQFSAGTFYRYANVNLDRLVENTGDAQTARTAVAEFLRAFLSTVPSGKQNATAAMTLPDLVHIAVRFDRPISFAPAFETALYGSDGYTLRACQELNNYAERLREVWPDDAIRGYATVENKTDLAALGERYDSYPALIDAMVAAAFEGERE